MHTIGEHMAASADESGEELFLPDFKDTVEPSTDTPEKSREKERPREIPRRGHWHPEVITVMQGILTFSVDGHGEYILAPDQVLAFSNGSHFYSEFLNVTYRRLVYTIRQADREFRAGVDCVQAYEYATSADLVCGFSGVHFVRSKLDVERVDYVYQTSVKMIESDRPWSSQAVSADSESIVPRFWIEANPETLDLWLDSIDTAHQGVWGEWLNQNVPVKTDVVRNRSVRLVELLGVHLLGPRPGVEKPYASLMAGKLAWESMDLPIYISGTGWRMNRTEPVGDLVPSNSMETMDGKLNSVILPYPILPDNRLRTGKSDGRDRSEERLNMEFSRPSIAALSYLSDGKLTVRHSPVF